MAPYPLCKYIPNQSIERQSQCKIGWTLFQVKFKLAIKICIENRQHARFDVKERKKYLEQIPPIRRSISS